MRATRLLRVMIVCLAAVVPGASPARCAEPRIDRYNLVYFGAEGPVFFRVLLDSDGAGVEATRRDYSAWVFSSLDADASGQLEPEEAAKIPVEGRPLPGGATLDERWKELDTEADEGISDEELFAYLDGRMGPRFVVDVRPPRQVQRVPLGTQLDTDGDGQVGPAEVDAGMAPLSAFDFDDDGALSVAELQPFPTAILQAQRLQQARDPALAPIVALDSETAIASAAGRLVALYGGAREGNTFSPAEIPMLDTDGDGQATDEEWRTWLATMVPDVTLKVQLPERRTARVALAEPVHKNRRVEERRAPFKSRVAFEWAGTAVEVTAEDNRRQAGFSSAFYLQQFLIADGDKNKYLGEGEFTMLNLPGAAFSTVDGNGDGQLFREELQEFLRLDSRMQQTRVVLSLTDEGRTLFDLLDQNVDRRLTPRELRGGFRRMAPHDLNRDQRLAPVELASSYRLTFSFATPELFQNLGMNQMTPAARLPIVRPVTEGPLWFRKMDRNQDGDVAWREFLGPRTAFENIDADHDRLIDQTEAEATAASSGEGP